MTVADSRIGILARAGALALGAALSLGLARFAYALLLPAMRADLGWSYFTAGAMNTVNAAGYLLGALLLPRWMARGGARQVVPGSTAWLRPPLRRVGARQVTRGSWTSW